MPVRERRMDGGWPKRRQKLNGTDYFGPPGRKKRRTEEKMAAQLSNFHISQSLLQEPSSSMWFFMQKPQETMQDIEDR